MKKQGEFYFCVFQFLFDMLQHKSLVVDEVVEGDDLRRLFVVGGGKHEDL
jgi:hypothetical protein